MAKQRSNSSDLGISGNGAGKGDAPRNCFSQQFRDNYDSIDWGRDIEIIETGWTKENEDALHAFCDKIETSEFLCNTSSHKTS